MDEEQDAWFLHELYRPPGHSRRALSAFYRAKPLIPRAAQIAVRRAMVHRQARARFPAWPYEDGLLRQAAGRLAVALAERREQSLPVVGPWPDGAPFAFVLTHDVEGPQGLASISRLLEIERRHEVVSSWNLCAEWYPIAPRDLAPIEAAGCEIGVHGIRHDRSMFRDRASFERSLATVSEHMERWNAVGFRSPALHRNAGWMHELPTAYDSTFPHSDPFGPQPGGCCAIHPFFFGDVVELPITLDQDFTLFELMGQRDIALWVDKARWVIERGGLVNVIVHPDYMNDERLALYDELLTFLRAQEGGWHALPRDVAAWWRTRRALRTESFDGRILVVGDGAERATVMRVRVDEGVGVAYVR